MSSATGDRESFNGDIAFTAPTGGTTKGLMYAINDSYGVARTTTSATETAVFAIDGAVRMTKVTGTGKSFAAGDKVYLVSASKSASPSATGNTLIGVALETAATTATNVLIKLTSTPPVTAS